MFTRTHVDEMLRSASSVEQFAAPSCLPEATQRPGTLGNLDTIQKPAYRW